MQYRHVNHVNYEWQLSWCGDFKVLLTAILETHLLSHTASLDQPLVDEEAPVSGLYKMVVAVLYYL